MAGQGFSYGGSDGASSGFLGLEQKYVAAIIIAALLAVAILGAAFLMKAPASDPREVACIESGGYWNDPMGYCSRPLATLP